MLNSSLTDLGGFKPVIDESTGEITGYKTTIGGADTVFPFSNCDLENKIPLAFSCARGYYNAIVGKKYLVFVIDTRYNENTYVSMTGINILLQSPVISAGTIDSGSHGSGYMVVGIATDTNISCGYTGYALIIVQLD